METIKVTQPCKKLVQKVRKEFKDELTDRFMVNFPDEVTLDDVIFWLADEKLKEKGIYTFNEKEPDAE